MIINCFNEKVKVSNKNNYKVNRSAICFITTFSFCVIFIVEVYTVLIKVYTVFFGIKCVALKRAGCLVALTFCISLVSSAVTGDIFQVKWASL